MRTVQEILQDIQKSTYQKTQQNIVENALTTQDSYNCKKCKDTGVIYNAETNTAKICECQEKVRYQRMLESSGISEQFLKIGFKEFETKTDFQRIAKTEAINYVKGFELIEKERNNSIAFLGNCGAGKTHLSIAIANNLMAKNIGVLYMPYREVITRIKQVITDEIDYAKAINKYKTARVLLIDDFAKGKTTESDVNIMFEIINFRYLNRKPIILSSELLQDDLLDFDEAVGSRLIEMAKGRILEAKGIENNYRING